MNTFQLNDGHEIPQTGFGVFMMEPNGLTEQAVLMALKTGYRLIDTAAAYFNEKDVGKARQSARAEFPVMKSMLHRSFGCRTMGMKRLWQVLTRH